MGPGLPLLYNEEHAHRTQSGPGMVQAGSGHGVPVSEKRFSVLSSQKIFVFCDGTNFGTAVLNITFFFILVHFRRNIPISDIPI